MKTVLVTGPGQTSIVEVPRPGIGATDVLVRMRAFGICGSDSVSVFLCDPRCSGRFAAVWTGSLL
ncbi:threonine dehydrogenase-like Zn-dependent dehydrogenase [Actinoplanes couchii]|nr:threonine dehydrogenase-like Zn-dependent dehydrogenase [Actinoplanes couchii]